MTTSSLEAPPVSKGMGGGGGGASNAEVGNLHLKGRNALFQIYPLTYANKLGLLVYKEENDKIIQFDVHKNYFMKKRRENFFKGLIFVHTFIAKFLKCYHLVTDRLTNLEGS